MFILKHQRTEKNRGNVHIETSSFIGASVAQWLEALAFHL
jgi:hypothetical protein